jgi:hypothetical protein
VAAATTGATATVRVADHLFGLVDRGAIAIDTADWSNGLVVVMAAGALLYTGIHSGTVRVTADVLPGPPTEVDPGPWDDIVEASLYAPTGHLGVHQLEYLPQEEPPSLPVLSPAGPGHYRVRAHARGRDRDFDAAVDHSDEHYLLSVWPAAPLPPLIVRATDRCGYGLRLSALPPRPQPAPAPPPDRRRALLDNAILDNIARQADPD